MALYPGWPRLALTWIVPGGLTTTAPAQALTGALSDGTVGTALVATAVLLVASSLLFRLGQRRDTGGSS